MVAGVLAAAWVWWPLAAVAGPVVTYLWFGLHRRRMCAYCAQRECPGHPGGPPPQRGHPGFVGAENALFYGLFIPSLAVLLAAAYVAHLALGAVLTLLLSWGLWLYYRHVCSTCDLPCPLVSMRARATRA
jgi:hypothetical protein